MATLAEALQHAVRCHQAGRLAEAEHVYRQILDVNPRHVDALHLLGVLAFHGGQSEAAVDFMTRAVALDASNPSIHANLGAAFSALGRLAEAQACLEQAVGLRPEDAALHFKLGVLWRQQGRLDDAEASYRRALHWNPDHAEALSNLGAVLLKRGMLDEAEGCFRRALRLQPSSAEASGNLGVVLRKRGRLDEARAWCEQACRLDPEAEAYVNLGLVLDEQGRPNEAQACYRQALSIRPDHADAHNNLGTALYEQGRLDEAQACYRHALSVQPDHADAHNNLGTALCEQRQWAEALACFDRAVELDPDRADVRLNRAILWLLTGNFAQGWPAYARGNESVEQKTFAGPPWDGAPLSGRTILLHEEQGLGDTLQFIRYASLVKQYGGRVVFSGPDSLLRLLANCPGVDQVASGNAGLPPFDVHASLLSLPELLGTTLQSIPAAIPYLEASPEEVEHWRQQLHDVRAVRVGVVWQGNPGHKNDRRRSVPLATFEPLARVEGVQLLSLQMGAGREQLAALENRFALQDLGGRLSGDWAETAAVLKNLDLLVTVDTAVAHCAGALGVPVWVVLPFLPDWRWLLDREDSPWYPTMRLFRQDRPGNWQSVFARIQTALCENLLELRGEPV